MDLESSDDLAFRVPTNSFVLAAATYLKAHELFEEALTEEVRYFRADGQSDEISQRRDRVS